MVRRFSNKPELKKMPFLYKVPNYKPSGTCLLIIDPQNDFVDPDGSLAVKGAVQDTSRLINAINDAVSIDEIIVTLDTHQRYHIAHPLFWLKSGTKENPKPFTQISYESVKNKEFVPFDPKYYKWCLEYTKKLKRSGKFTLTIWPEHCLIGSWGHNVYPPLLKKIHEWEEKTGKTARYVIKGNNMLTEHYSAMKAEVVMKDDPNTSFNSSLMTILKKFDKIIVAGQALSHCVNFTVRDIITKLPKDTNVYLAIDTSSSVTGFEESSKKFLNDVKNRVHITKIDEISI